MYIQSFYNLIFPDENKYIIYNSYSGSIVVLSIDEYTELLSYLNKKMPETDLIHSLYKQGILIDASYDERARLSLLRVTEMQQTSNLYFRILPTTDCNARCFYCYESGIPHESMKEALIPEIVNFIDSCIQENTKKVNIQWYGGEPLLEFQTIYFLSIKCKELFIRRNVDYSFTMISNGILLDNEKIDIFANQLKLKKIQITLDGTSDEYKIRKSYICNFSDPFKRVINNIHSLLDAGIRVDIRLNCDGLNFSSILNLIDYLSKDFKGRKNLNVYPFPIYGSLGTKQCFSSTPSQITPQQFLVIIKKLISNRLMHTPSLKLKRCSCAATHFNSLDILPNGNLVKCMMNPNDSVGNIFSGTIQNSAFNKWCSLDLPSKCTYCKYLPLCQGGCIAGHLGYSKNSCFVYKDILYDLLKLLIQEQLSNKDDSRI